MFVTKEGITLEEIHERQAAREVEQEQREKDVRRCLRAERKREEVRREKLVKKREATEKAKLELLGVFVDLRGSGKRIPLIRHRSRPSIPRGKGEVLRKGKTHRQKTSGAHARHERNKKVAAHRNYDRAKQSGAGTRQ